MVKKLKATEIYTLLNALNILNNAFDWKNKQNCAKIYVSIKTIKFHNLVVEVLYKPSMKARGMQMSDNSFSPIEILCVACTA